MNNNLNIALTELKLKHVDFRPNLNELLSELKNKEINYYRTKVVALSEAVIVDPHNNSQQEELKSSLNQLERLLAAS